MHGPVKKTRPNGEEIMANVTRCIVTGEDGVIEATNALLTVVGCFR